MSKFYAFVIALTTLVSCGPAVLTPANTTGVLNHIPNIVLKSVEAPPPSPDQNITLQVALPLRNESDLDNFLEAILDPQNPNFGQVLTPQAFAARYFPTAEDVAAVQESLANAGMSVEGTANGTILHANTTVADAEAFFQTHLQGYTAPDGQFYVAPSANVTLPAGVPIKAVRGLTYGLQHHPHFVQHSHAKAATSGSGAFSPADIHAIYNVPTTLTGTGQVLGLFEFDGYNPSDIQGYERTYGLPNVTLTNVQLDGVQPGIQSSNGGAEVSLDIEYEIAMAPGLQEIVLFEGNTDVDMLNEIANPTQGEPLVGVTSCSWGLPENQVSAANLESDNMIFKQMVAQGQTFYDASGDYGAFDDGKNVVVDEYAGQPYVVGVGGTTLTVTGTNTYASETTWWTPAQGVGSGGGISTHWPIPTWQAGLSGAAAKASTTMRNAPDVALNADPATGYAFFYQGAIQDGIGGTSCAAPLWAGFTALLNQQRIQNGLQPVPFMAPLLYGVANSSRYSSAFHDIANNSNNGFYPAVAGLDNAAGWGTLNGAGLIAALGSNTPPAGTTGTTAGGTGTTATGATTGGGTGTTTGGGIGGGATTVGAGTVISSSNTTGGSASAGTGTGATNISMNSGAMGCAATGGDMSWGLMIGLVGVLSVARRRRG